MNEFEQEVLESLFRKQVYEINCDCLIKHLDLLIKKYDIQYWQIVPSLTRMIFGWLDNVEDIYQKWSWNSNLFLKIIEAFVVTEEDQMDFLKTFEEIEIDFPDSVKYLQDLISFFFNKKVLKEEVIVEWFHNMENQNIHEELFDYFF